MANPPRAKGTAGETEFVRLAERHGRRAERREANHHYDVKVFGEGSDRVVNAVAIRPDRGEWLVTINATDFFDLLDIFEGHVETKRFARSFIHSIYRKKFG